MQYCLVFCLCVCMFFLFLLTLSSLICNLRRSAVLKEIMVGEARNVYRNLSVKFLYVSSFRILVFSSVSFSVTVLFILLTTVSVILDLLSNFYCSLSCGSFRQRFNWKFMLNVDNTCSQVKSFNLKYTLSLYMPSSSSLLHDDATRYGTFSCDCCDQ
jgi:hypothetical protein